MLFYQVAIATVHSGAAIISVITTQCLTVTLLAACVSLTSTNKRKTVFPLWCQRAAVGHHCCEIRVFNSQTKKYKKHVVETRLQIK